MRLFKQSLRDVESMYRDDGVYDMEYREIKYLRREAWSEKYNYLYFDMTRDTKNKVNIVFAMKTKTHILNVFMKVNLFNFFEFCFQIKI